jgi:GWxTD domain-containing protein
MCFSIMRYITIALLLFVATAAHSQALRDINYSYQYDPVQPVRFVMKVTRNKESFTAHYNLSVKDSTHQFTVHWELRSGFNEKEGIPVPARPEEQKTTTTITGKLTINASAILQILVAKVVDEADKRAWIFYSVLEPAYPADAILSTGNRPVLESFVNKQDEVTYNGPAASAIVTYYSDNFPSAAPPFSESQARVSQGMKPDSVFSITSPQRFAFTGLYLLQQDTTSADGIAFRVEDDYPRLAKVQSLAEPLIYVCTKQEFDKIRAAQGDKKAFDRAIISITGDTDRARTFMRSYFRRVELANQYFTSYKEGWKTDRGMIFIIFGVPDEVVKFADREVWGYKNSQYDIAFNFTRSGTVFDPDNFVLIRQKKFQDTWYQVIDLWRNARF